MFALALFLILDFDLGLFIVLFTNNSAEFLVCYFTKTSLEMSGFEQGKFLLVLHCDLVRSAFVPILISYFLKTGLEMSGF